MLEYWYVFPVAIAISTVAMMAGIGGAILFSPFFMVVMKLEPVLALFSGIFIEVFGFSSGVAGYLKAKAINFKFARKLLPAALWGAVIGVVVGHLVPGGILKILLATVLLYISHEFIEGDKTCQARHPDCTGATLAKPKTLPKYLKHFTFAGGLLLGMVSSGLGEINEYNFLKQMKMKLSAASGTSVFIIAVTALTAVLVHLMQFSAEMFSQVFPIIIFAVPGVILGAQIGVRLSQKIESTDKLERGMGILFITLAILIIIV